MHKDIIEECLLTRAERRKRTLEYAVICTSYQQTIKGIDLLIKCQFPGGSSNFVHLIDGS